MEIPHFKMSVRHHPGRRLRAPRVERGGRGVLHTHSVSELWSRAGSPFRPSVDGGRAVQRGAVGLRLQGWEIRRARGRNWRGRDESTRAGRPGRWPEKAFQGGVGDACPRGQLQSNWAEDQESTVGFRDVRVTGDLGENSLGLWWGRAKAEWSGFRENTEGEVSETGVSCERREVGLGAVQDEDKDFRLFVRSIGFGF